MKSVFSNDVSTGKGDFWSFTSYFVFVAQYSLTVFLYDLSGQYLFHIYF